MNSMYSLETRPVCKPEAVIRGERFRITVLTPALIRLEYSESGIFEDRATQVVLSRDFPVPDFKVINRDGVLKILTDRLSLEYDTARQFSENSLFIKLLGNLSLYSSIWRFGQEPRDLGGTARTLDAAEGSIPLGHGLISRNGLSVIDDSNSMVLANDGWIEAREHCGCDMYFFGYGHDYEQCLKDFYFLCGRAPLLPRWALGNWWSRYHRYNDAEYRELIQRFERERIPFSVAVIDMDWHLVDIDPSYGNGWTGYTWNTELFPDPPAFLDWLHDHNLKVTLNIHPAAGIRAYEKAYPEVAAQMGASIKAGEPVEFDITDRRFVLAYFDCVHHPLEDEGVDFWWIDWQQGEACRMPGLDPLWALNHYHYIDSGRRNRCPIILSRYAGVGSHRYPIGFSGDAVLSWGSLAFQPYFTANASNIGFGWWSHDIGGHLQGSKDDELMTRWVQFGAFSPILRLHSSNNQFSSKEPWRFNKIAEQTIKEYLRLRHRLIPYIYTMNRIASYEGQPLIRPMYYLEPERDEAYNVPNEYYFGTELIAAPITEPLNRKLLAAKVRAWIPEGIWFDFFSGFAYKGGRMMQLWRPIENTPVLAKAGGIVPMNAAEYASAENPKELEMHIFPGADGRFMLWEDGNNENWAATVFELAWGDGPGFCIMPAEGNPAAIPESRKYTFLFRSVEECEVSVLIDNNETQPTTLYDESAHTLSVALPECGVSKRIDILFPEGLRIAHNNTTAAIYALLDRAQIEYDLKEQVQRIIESRGIEGIASLHEMDASPDLISALSEIMFAFES